jgi:hypothetical protein
MDSNVLAEILSEAVVDEYKARDTYQRDIDTLGPVCFLCKLAGFPKPAHEVET